MDQTCRIHGRTLHDVSRFIGVDPVFIDERIRELEREWDVERTLEANAAIAALAGIALGVTVDRRFLAVPLLVIVLTAAPTKLPWRTSNGAMLT